MFPVRARSDRRGGEGDGGLGGPVLGPLVMGPTCPFVSRGCLADDELLQLDPAADDGGGVFRSTPVAQIAFASATATVAPASVASVSASASASASSAAKRIHFAPPSPSQLVRKVPFASIAEEFPLSTTGTSNLAHFAPPSVIFQQPTAPTVTGACSSRDRVTPPLSAISEMTQPDEQTILNRSMTIKKESVDDDRHSPFGPVCHMDDSEPRTYHYGATKTEEDEMEQIKWNIQEQVFQRYFDLRQKEPQWGGLEIRESRVFFHPGKRREAIMTEKKFHDQAYKEGITGGDAAWYKNRRAQFGELVREFTRDETKHKQELMLAHLEKNSPFCKFPILGNRFLLTRLLGKGGNGEVWDVIDYADQKKRWALKLSVSHKHARREHYTHSRLCHQHIVGVGNAVYSIEYRQQLYTAFTVESVDTDLQQLIEMFESFDEVSSLKVLFQLLSALTYLHDQMRIAHYDIKPTNILIGRDECVKLTDFDLARHVHEPINSSIVGTLRYLPPECFRPMFGECQGTAEKADIWMVGIVYCVMLWGKHPLVPDKASHEEARAAIGGYNGHVHYPRPVSELSRWIIQGCLHSDPRCRPSACQLLQALQNASQH